MNDQSKGEQLRDKFDQRVARPGSPTEQQDGQEQYRGRIGTP
jgi:hypothetical protein